MLTKNDLKQIDRIVSRRIKKDVPAIIDARVPAIIDARVPAIIDSRVPGIVERQLSPLKKDIRTIKTDVAKIRKDLDVTISFFDREYIELRRRVDRLEEHLHLPPLVKI